LAWYLREYRIVEPPPEPQTPKVTPMPAMKK